MEYETLDGPSQTSRNKGKNSPKKEPFYDDEKNINRDDFSSMLIDLLKRINFKIAIFLFLVGIFIFSDLFIEMILSKFSGAVEGNETTTKGTILQLLFMSISYIMLDLLVQGDIL